MAVGLGARERFGRDHRVPARTVVHHHRLSEFPGKVLAERARGNIRPAPRGKRHQDAQRLGREGLRRGDAAQCAKQDGENGSDHGFSLHWRGRLGRSSIGPWTAR